MLVSYLSNRIVAGLNGETKTLSWPASAVTSPFVPTGLSGMAYALPQLSGAKGNAFHETSSARPRCLVRLRVGLRGKQVLWTAGGTRPRRAGHLLRPDGRRPVSLDGEG